MKRHKISIKQSGERLDVVATDWLNLTRSAAAKFIRSGEILLNGLAVKPGEITKPGDSISYQPVARRAANLRIPIIYQDDDIMVLDKPAGLVVHPTGQNNKADTLVDFVIKHTSDPDRSRPGIIHRLDKDTSGLIIVARNLTAKTYMQRLFASRAVQKEYLALVKGVLPHDQAEINLPIAAGVGIKRTVQPGGRLATTDYQVIKRYPAATLLRAWPKSGRTHQLRVHFAAIGHPIIGDNLYGSADIRLDRHFLHAHKLAFTGPNGNFIEVTSELPKALKDYLDTLE